MVKMPVGAPSSESARRKRLGEIALEKGLISRSQLSEALVTQRELTKLGLSERIGQILFKKEFLSREALKEVLREQDPNVRRLGNFEIFEKIGQGAMGVVFRARQISMERIVALKILAPKYAQDPEFIERFVREARAAGQFNHVNIVSAVDVGYAEPYHYFAMEYVEGVTLREVLKKQGALPVPEALEIALQVARALDHAHARSIIHRDVKPDNIMRTKNGVAKLLDLGLACAVRAEARNGAEEDGPAAQANEEAREKEKRITNQRKALGTPHYISPEAARGEADLDTRSDIYSLGCTLYHLLTGETPFSGSRSREVMARHISEGVPDVRKKCPQATAAVVAVVAKMTARERERRYANPAQLMEDLEALLQHAKPKHALASPTKRGGKRRGLTTTGPRPPISNRRGATTGPRVPIGGRGTTGPRRPIHARGTTGPAPPILGDRTGKISVSVGGTPRPATGAAKPKGGIPLWMPIAAGVVVTVGLIAAMTSGGRSGQTRPARRAEIPASKIPATGPKTAAAPAPNLLPKKLAIRAAPPPNKETLAQKALREAEALRKENPDRFPALLAAFARARAQAQDTRLAKEAEGAEREVRTRWRAAWEARLKNARREAEAALGKHDYGAALSALSEQHVAANLQAADWKERLETERRKIQDAAEAAAAKLLKQARAQARSGDAAGLQAAIEHARKAQAIPAALAPSAAEAAAALKPWEARLVTLRKAEEEARKVQTEQGRERLAAVQKELAPLLQQNRFTAALELLERRLRERDYAAAAEPLRRERADLRAILALRRGAVAALRQKAGQKIVLKKGRSKLAGRIKDERGREGVTLQLAGGPELTIRAGQLDAADVDAYAPRDGAGGAAEDLRRRGLLFLAAGDWRKAKTYFTRAREAGLGDQAIPYLERIEVLELGVAEIRARKAWAAAEKRFAEKQWKEARQAFVAFQAQHAQSKIGAAQAPLLQARLAEIERMLNPLRPGLAAAFYQGREFKKEALLQRRVDRTVDFNWGGGPPDPKVPGDNFCIRWTGFVKIAKAGEYTFATISDDGARLWVAGQQVINDWRLHAPTRASGTITLKAGRYPIKLEFFERGGGAACHLRWALKGGFAETVIPPGALWHQPGPALAEPPPAGKKQAQ